MLHHKTFAMLGALALAAPLAASDAVLSREAEHEFAPGGRLKIHFRAGDLRIVRGADPKHLKFRFTATHRHQDASQRIQARFDVFGPDAEIHLTAPNNVEVEAVVEVPSPVSLYVRMLAGDLTVEGLEGNKDLENHFGDLTVLDPATDYSTTYRKIDASVNIGDLDGFPADKVHGWLGKSGEFYGSGQYRLHAHVGAGDVRLGSK